MADYGVPADLDGTLPWSWAERRLLDARNFWLTTASRTGRPHSLPVWGVWLADRQRFWFSCASSSRKLRNILANPCVVFAPEDSVDVVSIEGVATQVSAEASHDAIDRYIAKYWDDPTEWPTMIEFLTSNAMVEVAPARGFGIIEREAEFATRATRWVW